MSYLKTYYPDKGPMFSVAPMMDWTDRHCRFFHRLLTKHTLLYTEMVVADAVIYGDRERLLGFDNTEHPLALQLGGSDPRKLANAAQHAEQFGFDEINLNVGCPSDRVQSGTFGACLMREPELVGRCVAEMKNAVSIPVTVKCRIGVDEQEPKTALDDLAHAVWRQGADALWVHARKAWLQGLSPKENRDIPPLNYDRVYDLKQENPNQFIGINGGIESICESTIHLGKVDGVMLGRAAYHNPTLLKHVDREVYGSDQAVITHAELLDRMCAYAEAHLAKGGRLNQITRHMIGLFQAVPGARAYRQILSTGAVKPGAGPEVLELAFSAVLPNLETAA